MIKIFFIFEKIVLYIKYNSNKYNINIVVISIIFHKLILK